MKKQSIIYYLALLLAVAVTSCAKVEPKFNSNNLTVTFNAPTATYLTADKTVNAKDSLDFSYSGSCTNPITYVTLTKNDTEVGRDSIKTGDRTSFSNLVKKMVADTIPGNYVYKVVARDKDNIYLGSSDPIIVTVTSNFNFYTNRRLYVPDSTAKTSPCFINLATGTTYSYTDVMSGNLSAQVDMGYFFSTDSVNTATSATATRIKTTVGHTFYSPNSTPATGQRAFYDLSSWTKNATQLNIATSPSFASLNSSGALKAAGLTNLKTNYSSVPNYSLWPTPQSSFKGIATASLIFFKTAAGKYGVINITYISSSGPGKGGYVNFDYKIQQ